MTTSTEPSARKIKVLIIDDDEPIAEYFSELLISKGFETTVFNSSIDALHYCQTNLEKYQLVISDIHMPDMTGDQLAKAILGLNSTMPIILCSGYNYLTRHELLAIGVKEFITKPIDSAKLLRIISDLKLCFA